MRIIGLIVVFTLLAGTASALLPNKESHIYIGYVLDAWADTPDQMGLLPTAQAEAAVALKHIAFALDSRDLKHFQLHIGHVKHVLDPEVEANGPGLGYGLVKAARGATSQIGLASLSDGVSVNVYTHAMHAEVSATNVIHWAEEALDLARTVKSATSRKSAGPSALKDREVVAPDRQRGGPRRGRWRDRLERGGLAQVEEHMLHMAAGEGLN